MQELRENIKAIAKEENISELEAISLLQAGAAKVGADDVLDALCEIKYEDYIKDMI